jgi:energy-coupling factor transport system permease protein
MSFLNDISLGYYYPADSFIHRLDPRTKLITLMLLMTVLVISIKLTLLSCFFALTCVIIFFSRIPISLIFRNLNPFLWLFALTIAVHLLWTPGQIIFTIPFIHASLTLEGLHLGVVYSVRLALMVVFAALLTLTTSPIELTDALERLFAPLKRLRLPIHEIVMMLTLSLRFIPTLLEEAQRIKNAQVSRGATFEGGLIRRMQNVVPLILPLFVSAFRRADELALAMDARCYFGGEGRTSYKHLRFVAADLVILSSCAVFMLVIIVLKLFQ